jgi:DNA-binding IclR family transcriptional regulator
MQALDRIMRIIETVAAAPAGSSATEVADRIGLSLSTVSRLMNDLADADVIERSENSGRFQLGNRLIKVVQSSTRRVEDPGSTRALMRELRDFSGETVSLHLRVGTQRVCVESIPSKHAVARFIPVGGAQPLVGSASGEILLAWLSAESLDQILDQLAVPTPQRPELEGRLDEIRERHWAVHKNRIVLGVTGVSAAVPDFGVDVAALSVSGPSERFGDAEISRVLPTLVEIAAQVSELTRLAT